MNCNDMYFKMHWMWHVPVTVHQSLAGSLKILNPSLSDCLLGPLALGRSRFHMSVETRLCSKLIQIDPNCGFNDSVSNSGLKSGGTKSLQLLRLIELCPQPGSLPVASVRTSISRKEVPEWPGKLGKVLFRGWYVFLSVSPIYDILIYFMDVALYEATWIWASCRMHFSFWSLSLLDRSLIFR